VNLDPATPDFKRVVGVHTSFKKIIFGDKLFHNLLTDFHQIFIIGRYLIVDYGSDLLFCDRSRGVVMAINFSVKIGEIGLHLHSSPLHSETDCNIALLNLKDSSTVIGLYRVNIR